MKGLPQTPLTLPRLLHRLIPAVQVHCNPGPGHVCGHGHIAGDRMPAVSGEWAHERRMPKTTLGGTVQCSRHVTDRRHARTESHLDQPILKSIDFPPTSITIQRRCGIGRFRGSGSFKPCCGQGSDARGHHHSRAPGGAADRQRDLPLNRQRRSPVLLLSSLLRGRQTGAPLHHYPVRPAAMAGDRTDRPARRPQR